MTTSSDDFIPLIEPVARHLLGEPNAAQSSRSELRFGRKGSISVDLKKGTWFDWESVKGGGVLDLVAWSCGLPSRDAAAEWLRAEHYLEEGVRRPAARLAQPVDEGPDQDQARKFTIAMRVWRETAPAPGTAVEAYLQSRRISVKPIPARLRHTHLRHKSGSTWDAMVAVVTHGVTDRPTGIHRTFLDAGGAGKAPVEPCKMALGPWLGGCVKLAPPAEHLLVGEGIETCLAAMQDSGVGAWAALSTSGLKNLDLPVQVRKITVLADNDPVNSHGVRPGEVSARAAASRWRRQGREVRIAWPPDEGTDFADMVGKESN